jgi:hypothetical protein
MPYAVQSSWDAALGAAGAYMQGTEAKRQQQKLEERQARQDQYQQALAQQSAARLQLEAQRGEREQKKFGEDEADRTRAVKLEDAVAQQNSSLRYPPGWEKMSPMSQIAYLRKRQQAEQGIGNVKGFTDTQSEIADRERQITEQQRAAEIASLIHSRDVTKPQEFEQGLGVREQGLNDSLIKAANAQAGAWGRFNAGQADTDARQQRGFKHTDVAHPPKSVVDPTTQNQVKLLMEDLKHTVDQAAKTGKDASLPLLRAGAIKHGYPPHVVDMVLGKGAAAPPAAPTASSGNLLKDFWDNLMKPAGS